MQANLSQITKLVNAVPHHFQDEAINPLVTGITTDSRSLQHSKSSGELFLALRGEKFDGHEFVSEAIARGAIGAITDKLLPLPVPQLVVEDTLAAYQQIASWWRQQFDIPIIAVTGSVGKTTTKELIAALLATHGKVLKSKANFNNEIGVPKTIFELSFDHSFAVIEMAMRGVGQIALLTEIARPTIGVITNVGTAHIGLLGSEEAIARAKCELLAEMPPTGVAILNQDDRRLMSTAATVWQGETLTYGLGSGDLQGRLIDSNTLELSGVRLPLPLPGRHNAANYLAALAVAQLLNIDWKVFAKGLSVTLPQGRAQRHELPNDIVILDETYNAGLESMQAALHLLAETPGKRHIAVLGTMKELGIRSPEFHQQVGETARELHLDAVLVLVDDPQAEAIAFGSAGIATETFPTHETLINRLQETIQPGDRLLFKASHSVRLDRVVSQLMADP
ncbi:MAG: UDP-N-acetylmuramoyl-tripeptide--D-alanyl-D-alanine ligase [Hormoscilla sp.]